MYPRGSGGDELARLAVVLPGHSSFRILRKKEKRNGNHYI